MSQLVLNAYGIRKQTDAGARRHLEAYCYVNDGSTGILTYHRAGSANAGGNSTGALTADRLYALPFASPRGGSIDRLLINVTTTGAGSSTYVGVYKSTTKGTNLYPGALVVDAGTIDTSGATGVKTYLTGLPITLEADELYWFVCLCNTTAPTLRAFNPEGCHPIFGIDTAMGTTPGLGLWVAQTYGALPATFPASATTITAVTIPIIACQYAT